MRSFQHRWVNPSAPLSQPAPGPPLRPVDGIIGSPLPDLGRASAGGTFRAMTTAVAPEAPSSDDQDHRLDRLGWAAVAVITAIVGLSWFPVLHPSWDNNHGGRVFARLALQVRNLHELGIRGSDLGTSWVPYASHAYAHHPPMADLLSQLVGLLPGETEWQVRL